MKTRQIVGKLRMADGLDINLGIVSFNGEELFSCDVNNDLDVIMFQESANKFKNALTFSEKEALKKATKWEIKKDGVITSLKMKHIRDDEPMIKTIEFTVIGNKFIML